MRSVTMVVGLQYAEIMELTGQSVAVPPPKHVFAVTYSESANERFSERRGDRPVIHAYHGSRLENFHSILHYGLQGHMNKVSCCESFVFVFV
jgi:poly[ADP-ribose] polymerase 16